jgi:hypothetical protein
VDDAQSAGDRGRGGRVLVYRQARPDPGIRLILVVGAVIVIGFALLRLGERSGWWAAADNRPAAIIIAADFVIVLGLTTLGRFGRLPELFAPRMELLLWPDRLEWRDGRGGSGRAAWAEISAIETVTMRRNIDSEVRNLAGDAIVWLPSRLSPVDPDDAVGPDRSLGPSTHAPGTLQELAVELHPERFELRRRFPSYFAAVALPPEPPESGSDPKPAPSAEPEADVEAAPNERPTVGEA